MRRWLLLLLFAPFFTPAYADLKICNRMSYVAEVAIGLDDKGTTATRGWFRVDPAQCRVVLQGALTAERTLLNARSLALYGASPLAENGTDMLCTAPENFVIAAARQCRAGQTAAAFTPVKPVQGDDGHLTATLSENSDYDDEQARLAGIQRLLGIAGYDATPIDGVDGKKTQTAIAAFLKSRGLAADIVATPAIFDTLIAAAQSPSAVGLTWCNDTPHRVMAAIATEDGKSLVSRGWYRIEPGKCTRPDVAPQARLVFSFAEAVDAEGRVLRAKERAVNWGGTRIFCTRESKFEITDHADCGVRGLVSTGFIPVEIGSGGKTLRFAMP